MDGYLTLSDVARRLGVRRAMVQFYVDNGQMPAPTTKFGNRLYYLPTQYAAIKAAFEARERKPYTYKTARAK